MWTVDFTGFLKLLVNENFGLRLPVDAANLENWQSYALSTSGTMTIITHKKENY